MTLLRVTASVAALAVATILWLLTRLNRLQLSRERTIFVRSWSYLLTAQNYTAPARHLLPRLRVSLAVLGVSVIVAIWTIVDVVRHQAP